LEGVCNSLDPKFNIAEEFEPYAQDVLPRRLGIEKVMDVVKEEMLDLEYIARNVPSALRSFFKKVDEGKIRIELEHKDLMVFSADLDRISNKLSVALLVAALIVGSSIIVPESKLLGLAGFVVSGILGLWLALKVLLD
jgi:ubiquinone biosynthesis protein